MYNYIRESDDLEWQPGSNVEEDREMEQMQTEQMDPVEIERREQEEGRGISLVDIYSPCNHPNKSYLSFRECLANELVGNYNSRKRPRYPITPP